VSEADHEAPPPAPEASESDAAREETAPAQAETSGEEREAGTEPPASGGRPASETEPTAAIVPDELSGLPAANRVLSEGAAAEPMPPPPASPRRRRWLDVLAERPEVASAVPRDRLAAQTRRDFLLLGAGLLGATAMAWWLLPDRAKSRLLPGTLRQRLDTLAARAGLSPQHREEVLDRALTFDDDVAEALYSRERRVRAYDRSQVTPLRNNYNGQTPEPEYLATWTLRVSGLASGRPEHFRLDELVRRFPLREQVTRLVCVEGWSAIAWWGGIGFADFLAALPPAPGTRWAAIRSAVNLDEDGDPDPYYVSIDLETARHPQTLLATHFDGQPLTVAHGAPLRLVAPMKLGLKNIKAVTGIEYTIEEPRDYWNERGYSKYDGL
jgi:DMSO/TMAO reductase YedYZ molybdopterin-dependent catalytic subunit